MNYQEEIINTVKEINHEPVLRFFYSLLRRVTADPDVLQGLISLFGSE